MSFTDRNLHYCIRVSIACLTLGLMGIFACEAHSQLIYENSFEHWDQEQIYDRDMWDADWLEPVWEDGIREERVSIVRGNKAYRGRGSALAV